MARGNTDGNTVGGLFYKVREEQLLMPLQDAIREILSFIEYIPELFAQDGFIKDTKKEEARLLLLSELDSRIAQISHYIQDFIKACTRRNLAAAAALAAY